MASSIIRFFKLASVESVKTVCVCIFFHYFKYYGQNIFSRIMELYLIAKVERTNFLFKTWNYLVSERKERQNVSGYKAINKDVRKQLFHHSSFFLICQVCRPLCKENVNIYNTIFTTETMKYTNKYTWFSHKIFVFYGRWKIKNIVFLDVRSAPRHEVF